MGQSGDQAWHPARRFWAAFETLHAVTYFAPSCTDAMTDAGALGFWMSYFVGRLCPLGPVGPEVATAVCFGFSPERPARALPDGWALVAPEEAVRIRRGAAAAALREAHAGIEDAVAPLLPQLERLVAGLDPAGRPLAAANLALTLPDDPVERLWQLTTTLREHRGDGHVAVWVAEGFSGCESNVLAAAVRGGDADRLITVSRVWSDEVWSAATAALVARGLVSTSDGVTVATPAGHATLAGVESCTDRLAAASYRPGVDDGQLNGLASRMTDLARPVAHAGVIRYPNPMGLPPLA